MLQRILPATLLLSPIGFTTLATEIWGAFEEGLYADTGLLPSEPEGLAALVVDPGVSGWQGPYVATERGDPVDASPQS